MSSRRVGGSCLAGAIFVALLFAVLPGCAPKQVRVYDAGPGIRNDIVQHALGQLGRPYRNGAKGPDAFDCSGFIHFVYKRVGVAVPVMTEAQIGSGVAVYRDNVLPGDLVFFKIKKDLHAGIMINRRDFVHSAKSRGVAVDDVESTYWKRTLIGFRTLL